MNAVNVLTALYDLWAQENGKQIEIEVEETGNGRLGLHPVVDGEF